jgi:transcriptional regulator NrdR family protein
MECLHCGHKLQVSNSRSQHKSNSVWRRRFCSNCKATFTSVEDIDLGKAVVFERSKTDVEPFSRDKLLISIYEACKHRKDAVAAAAALTATIIHKLLPTLNEPRVTRGDICTLAHQVLRRYDKAAASAYIAYHPITASS